MLPMSRVGLNTGRITDEETIYIDRKVVETARALVVGRKLFPTLVLPNAGFLTVRGYRQSDMSAAKISLFGQPGSKDRTEKTAFDITEIGRGSCRERV